MAPNTPAQPAASASITASVVGAHDAKTHLAALLDRVERGEEVLITRHGRPVARLSPAAGHDLAAARAAAEALLALGQAIAAGTPFTAAERQALRDLGRRF